MAYKFQLGSAIVSGSLTRDAGNLAIRDHDNNTKAAISASSGNAQFEGTVSGAAGSFHALNGFSLTLQEGGISSAGAIAGATSIDASGDLTVGTITMAEFTVAANGNTDIDGTLNVEGVPTFQAGAVFSAGITTANAIAGATTVSGSGLAQFGQVRADGGLTSQGLDILSATRAFGNVTTVSGSGKGSFLSLALDSVDVTATAAELNYLDNDDLTAADLQKLADVTATAAELNYTDVTTAGTAQASKAVILDASKDISGLNQVDAVGLSGSLEFSLDVAANGGLGMTPFQNNANVSDLKISGSFMQAAAVDVATDEVMMLDADGSVKRESFVDLATAMAGAGLTATNGVFSTDAGAVQAWSDGTAFAEGYNYATGSGGGSAALPASPSVGDSVTVKNSSAGTITINKGDGAHSIDEQDSIILESPYAAVTMVYMVANKWKIV